MQLLMLYASAPAASTVHRHKVKNIISMLKPCANMQSFSRGILGMHADMQVQSADCVC